MKQAGPKGGHRDVCATTATLWDPIPRDLSADLACYAWTSDNPAPEIVAYAWTWRQVRDGAAPSIRDIADYAGRGKTWAQRVRERVVRDHASWATGTGLAVLNGTAPGQSRDTAGTDDALVVDVVAEPRDSTGTVAGQSRDTSRARDLLRQDRDREKDRIDPSTLEGIGTLSSRVLDPLDPQQQDPQDGPQEPQQDRGVPHSPAEDPQDAASGQPGAAMSMLEGDQGGGSAVVESKPHWTADLWAQLQAIRSQHTEGARGQGLTPKRRANLQTRCKELRQAGLSRDDLLRAARWVHESANIRAEGARTTGDPLAVLLRPAHCVEYCELAEAEEREAATLPDRREGERRDGDERRSESRHGAGRDRPPAGSRALADLARRLAEKEAAKAAAEATRAPALRLVET